jgi:hypothetical protein
MRAIANQRYEELDALGAKMLDQAPAADYERMTETATWKAGERWAWTGVHKRYSHAEIKEAVRGVMLDVAIHNVIPPEDPSWAGQLIGLSAQFSIDRLRATLGRRDNRSSKMDVAMRDLAADLGLAPRRTNHGSGAPWEHTVELLASLAQLRADLPPEQWEFWARDWYPFYDQRGAVRKVARKRGENPSTTSRRLRRYRDNAEEQWYGRGNPDPRHM